MTFAVSKFVSQPWVEIQLTVIAYILIIFTWSELDWTKISVELEELQIKSLSMRHYINNSKTLLKGVYDIEE